MTTPKGVLKPVVTVACRTLPDEGKDIESWELNEMLDDTTTLVEATEEPKVVEICATPGVMAVTTVPDTETIDGAFETRLLYAVIARGVVGVLLR